MIPSISFEKEHYDNSHLRRNRYEGLSAYQIAVKNGFVGTETEWLESLKATDKYYEETKKKHIYLYDIDFDDIDYDYAYKHFNDMYNHPEFIPTSDNENASEPFKLILPKGVACSSVRNGNFYGRSFDWFYDNSVAFIVRTPSRNHRYASVSISNSIPGLMAEDVENRSNKLGFKTIPFYTLDGINEKGLVCNTNVVPTGDHGYTRETNKDAKVRICQLMLPRYILDHYATAQEAVLGIKNDLNVYGIQNKKMNIELHFMVADLNNTFIVEFIDNHVVINNVTNGRPYMTNFYVTGMRLYQDNTAVDPTSVTPFSIGLERYERILANYDSCNTLEGMKNMLHELRYSQTYLSSTTPRWKTEFCGDYTKAGYGVLTVDDPIEKFEKIMADSEEMFNHRTREEANTDFTCHATVYDLEKKIMYLSVQEDYEVWYTNSLEHYYTKDDIDHLIAE